MAPLLNAGYLEERELEFSWINWHEVISGSWLWGLSYRKPELLRGDVTANYDLGALETATYPVTSYPAMDYVQAFAEKNHQQNTAVFVQLERKLSAQFALTVGARYDSYADSNDSLNPRLALVWQAQKNNSVKLLYGEAFRAPTLAETAITNNERIESNPDLKPEKIRTAELQWMHKGTQLEFSAGVFYSEIEDAIKRAKFFGLDGKESFGNIDTQRLSGQEVGLKYDFDRHWRGELTASHFSKLSESPQREADLLSSAAISYQRSRHTVSLSAYYHGEKQDQLADKSIITSPAYSSMSANWRFEPSARISYYCSGENLGNAQFYGRTDDGAVSQGAPSKGRVLRLGLKLRL
jgi:iron complex outermembrane receptor protein